MLLLLMAFLLASCYFISGVPSQTAIFYVRKLTACDIINGKNVIKKKNETMARQTKMVEGEQHVFHILYKYNDKC